MAFVNSDAIRSTDWLAAHLGQAGVKILDASYYLKMQNRDARGEYGDEHIPGAGFFDIEEICDKASPLPHMLPSAVGFAAAVGALGISNDDHVVLYDGTGFASAAARGWWMFRCFGHDKVSVLDGGFPKWLREQRDVEEGLPNVAPAVFTATFAPGMVRGFEQVKANLADQRELVLDARSAGRFKATEPELWPVKKQGHIPGSVSLPFPDLIDDKTRALRSPSEVEARLAAAGVTAGRPVIATCGSGVTACVLALALHLTGKDDVAIYDGSWVEWGNRDDAPVDIG